MSTPDPPNADQPSQPAPEAPPEQGSTIRRSPAGELGFLTWLWAFAALTCVLWFVYGGAIHFPFIYDDKPAVLENPSIVRMWPILGEGERPGPLTPLKETVTSGRPLVNLSLALNYYYGGVDPTGYHLVNLVFHVLSATLLFAVARGGLRSRYFVHRYDDVATGLAFAIALVWAVHPLLTESVQYVAQRTELMVAFFYLLTLFASQRYFTATTIRQRGAWLGVAAAACSMGAGCKEVMVTAPVLVLLYDRTFETRSFRRALTRHWPLYLGLLISWGVILALNINGPRAATAGFHLEVSPLAWWLTQAKVLAIYLKLAVWPWPLVIHHGVPYVTSLVKALPWIGFAGALGLFVANRLWRRTAVGYLGAWALIILSPTLVVPIVTEVAAERRMYLSLAALVTLAIGLLYELIVYVQKTAGPATNAAAESEPATSAPASRQKAQGASPITMTLVCAGSLAIVLAVVSVIRLTAYRTEVSIWQEAADRQPDDMICQYNVGIYLIKQGRGPEALPYLRRTLELCKAPEPGLHKFLGAALYMTGSNVEAIKHLELAMKEEPGEITGTRLYGLSLLNAGRFADAITQLERVVKAHPDSVEDIDHLSAALINGKRYDEAADNLQKMLRLHPELFEARFRLALTYSKLDRTNEAIAEAERAILDARQHGGSGIAAQISDWLREYRLSLPTPTTRE